MELHNIVLKFQPLELDSNGAEYIVKIATLILDFDLEIMERPFLTPLNVVIILMVKNNTYNLHEKFSRKEPIAILAVGGSRLVGLDKLLDGEKIHVNYPMNYTILYNEEKNCIDIEIHDKQKTVVNDFDLQLIQHQNEKAKEMIRQKLA